MPLLTAAVLAAAGHSASANNYLSYTNDISVQTVLTQDRPDWCRGHKLMFDLDGLQRAYYGCWTDAQGFAHITMTDGGQRIMPLTQFTKLTGATK